MANKTTLANTLAQELGYKDAKALKDQIKRSGGGEFSSNVKGRLEFGAGFEESFRESAKDKVADIKDTFSKKTLKKFNKKTYNEFFAGDDIFSSYMRGRLNKGKKGGSAAAATEGGGTSPTKEGSEGVGTEELAVLNVIAKNCMSLPGIARDMNVLRQNLVKLVKLQPGGKDKARVGADMYFKTADQREDMLESQRAKATSKAPTSDNAKPEKKEEGGFLSGILNSVMSLFSGGFMTAIKSLFNPRLILKAITKVFIPLTIIASLVNGIIDGFRKWQKTGDLSEALITGLGGVLEFLTFGLFGTDELKKAFDWIGGFVGPIVDSISETFDSLKMWAVNNIGIPEISIPIGMIPAIWAINKLSPGAIPETISFGPYYPFKKNPKSTEPQKSERPAVKSTEAISGGEKAPPVTASSESTAPSPTSAAGGEAPGATPTAIKKKDGQELKLPQGVTYNGNDGMFNYKGVGFTAEKQDELDRQTKAIDGKTIVEYQGVGPSGPATITFDGTTGQKTFSAPKPEESQLTASSATPPAAGVASAGGGGGGGGSSGGASGSPTQTAPSGAALNADSSSVAEGQRLDSAADAGVTVNAPVTNNSSETTGKDAPSLIADAYNRDFVESYSFVS